jgi:superfamily I DNA/RNA helicase
MSVTWFVPRSDLSDDQLRAVDLPLTAHSLILGAPGSGKTLVLLHRAKRMIAEQGIPPERLRIFVFTNTLKDYIRSTLALLDIPESCVSTFDHWCREFYLAFVARRVPFGPHGPDFPAIRTGVLNKLRGGVPLSVLTNARDPNHAPVQQELLGDDEPRPAAAPQAEFPEFFAQVINCPLYDAALVDEGQDLTTEAFEILKRIARHVTVCMDARQQLYEERCEEPDILKTLGLRKCNLTILGAYRCCPYITRLAASLLRDPTERQAFLTQTKTVQNEKLTPLLYIAENASEEKNRLVQIIKDRQLTGDRIAILLPNNAKLFSLARLLTEAGLEVEVPSKGGRPTEYPTHDFQSDLPKLMTYYGAKGLTFETVIMPRLVPSSFHQVSPERLEKLFFVGITRATRWVYMSTVEGPTLPVIRDLANHERDGTITIQRSADTLPFTGGPARTTQPKEAQPADALTDLL